MPWDHRRFWFVDLIVLVLIGLFVAALLLPATRHSGGAARRNLCSNKLKQIGIALDNHHDVYKRFPAVSNSNRRNPDGLASVWWPDPGSAADTGAVPSVGYTTAAGTTAATAGYSWIVTILPYLDEAPLYGAIGHASDKFSADAFTPYDRCTGRRRKQDGQTRRHDVFGVDHPRRPDDPQAFRRRPTG